jgi:hypothetical protein
MKTVELKALAELVSQKESELAYGSETCILTGFVNEFGHVADALGSHAEIGADVLEAYKDAYRKLERLPEQGITDFIVSDLI